MGQVQVGHERPSPQFGSHPGASTGVEGTTQIEVGGVYWHRQASMPAQNNLDRAQMLRFAKQILDTLQRRREQIGDPYIGMNLERQLLDYHLRDLDEPDDLEAEDS